MTQPSERDRPPEDKDEWARIWAATDYAHELWDAFGPIAQIVKNRKFWLWVLAVAAAWNGSDLVALARVALGAGL